MGDGKKRICLVEDNEDNRLLIRAILADRYDIHECTDGMQAVAALEGSKPDLVLLDVALPRLDGIEVLRRIRQHDLWRDVPVIALTAHAMSGDRERYLAAGFDRYISKPIVDENQLIDAIEELLRERSRRS